MRGGGNDRQGGEGTMNGKLLWTGIAAVLTIILTIVTPRVCTACGGGRRVEAGRRPAGMAVPEGPRRPSGLPHRVVVFHGEPRRRGGRQVRVPAHVLPAGAPEGSSGPGKPLVAPGRVPGPLRADGYPEGFLLVRRTALPFRSGTRRRPDGGLDVWCLQWSARMAGRTITLAARKDGRELSLELTSGNRRRSMVSTA